MQEDVYRGDGLNLYAYCSNNPVMYYDPSGYYKASENLYDITSVGKKTYSSDLKAAMIEYMTGVDRKTAKAMSSGSHQAQHLIPQEFSNHPVIQVTGYQIDHCENGIFAINKNSSKPTALMDSLRQYQVSKSNMDKYITNTTQHGTDGINSAYHEAFSEYVGKQLDNIGDKYGLMGGKSIEELQSMSNVKDIKSELSNLNKGLRTAHQEGIDLYLKNNYNINKPDYYEGGKTKQQAQKDYEETNFGEKCK